MNGDVASVSVLVLGPLAVLRDGRVVPVAGTQQAAVLALLADRPGQAVSVDRLIDQAWGGDPPDSAQSALRVHVAKLRALLSTGFENPIQHGADGYRLDPAQVDSDAQRFTRLVSLARASATSVALASYDEALGLWRGSPYAGVRELPDLRSTVDRLVETRLDVEEERVDLLLGAGRHADVCAEIATLVQGQPLRERRTRQLMLALYRSGRQAEAMQAYGRLRDELLEELGIDPSPETRQLEAGILRQDPALALPSASADGEWSTRSVAGLDASIVTPAGGPMLHDLVTRRLEPLGPSDRRLVELVAVLDDVADDDVLAASLDVSVAALGRAVARCDHAGILSSIDSGEPRTLARLAWRAGILAGLTVADRADLHDAAADGLTRARPGSAAARVVAARHRVQASRLRSSVDDWTAFALVEAVDASLAAQQVKVARSVCADALALQGLPAGVVVDLTTRLVTTLSRLGEIGRADEVFHDGVAAARELGDPQRLALMVLAHDWSLRTVLVDDGGRLRLEEALEALGEQPSALRVRVGGALVLESAVPGRQSAVDELIATVVQDARELGDEGALWAALYARHASYRADPDPASRHRVAEELWQVAARADIQEWRAWAALAQIYDAFVGGEHHRTSALIEHLGRDSAAVQSPRLMWHHALIQSARSLDLGDVEASDQWADEALVIGASAGHPDALGAAAVHAMQRHFHRGTLGEFFPTIEEFAASIPDNILVHATRALALAQAGRCDESAVQLRGLGTRLATDSYDEFTLLAVAMCAETAVACRELAELAWIREILAPFSGQFVVFGQVTATWGPVDRVLGLLAGAEGRHEAAVEHLEAALELSERAGLDLWCVRCRDDLATVRARRES